MNGQLTCIKRCVEPRTREHNITCLTNRYFMLSLTAVFALSNSFQRFVLRWQQEDMFGGKKEHWIKYDQSAAVARTNACTNRSMKSVSLVSRVQPSESMPIPLDFIHQVAWSFARNSTSYSCIVDTGRNSRGSRTKFGTKFMHVVLGLLSTRHGN